MTAAAVAAGVGTLAAHAAPAAMFWPALRMRLLPALAGVGAPHHVALTFDDGPHPRSTPFFLRELDRHDVRATFFLLGSELARSPRLGKEMAAAGHEIALHGWHHRRMVWYGPRRTYDEMARGRDLIARTTGTRPRWFRPPYGVLTTAALVAARRLDLTPVLWTCWGWDWSSRSTPDSVVETVTKSLAGGGTVLLHDSDVAASVGAWKSTLGALPRLLAECAAHGWTVGPLRDHGIGGDTLPVVPPAAPIVSDRRLAITRG
ncbi:MAG TPA: polysaccharide deacetylase family protein [Pseudonocardiaceae bacterium]|jgi:peptidoglycan/xylan/chitin deacetylase (PgdA/CDA1 family)|nr:polysaccharide deacetylase family protein [Pseudonocardiaceae bacterium]